MDRPSRKGPERSGETGPKKDTWRYLKAITEGDTDFRRGKHAAFPRGDPPKCKESVTIKGEEVDIWLLEVEPVRQGRRLFCLLVGSDSLHEPKIVTHIEGNFETDQMRDKLFMFDGPDEISLRDQKVASMFLYLLCDKLEVDAGAPPRNSNKKLPIDSAMSRPVMHINTLDMGTLALHPRPALSRAAVHAARAKGSIPPG